MPRKTGVLVNLVVFVVLARALLLSAHAPAKDWPSERIERLATWLQAVRQHEPGEIDSSLLLIASWNNNTIRALWLDAQVVLFFSRCATCKVPLVRGVDGRVTQIRYSSQEMLALRQLADAIKDRRESNAIVKRGAILHADVVMRTQPEGEPHVNQPRSSTLPPAQGRYQSAATPDRMMLRTTDGRQESLRDDAIHWDIAYVLLELIAPDVAVKEILSSSDIKYAPDDTVRLWYRATTAYLQANATYDQYHYSRGVKIFPDDPDLAFLNGCLHEAQADARVQTVMRDVALPPGVVLSLRSEHDELESAEKAFRRTLELDPDYHEARIRLGRVLGKLGRHEQAAAELRDTSDNVNHVALRYYKALFLGHEAEALGHRDEARQRYTYAGDMFPMAQSPQIALSHLARESGDREQALARIRRVLDLPMEEVNRRDPYWLYLQFGGRFVDDWLDELYRPFRQRAGP